MTKNKKIYIFITLLILIAGFAVRMWKITNPIADWHSWRQTDTAAVARIFTQNGINLLYPKFNDLSNIPSGMDNPEGYRFVEFPIYNALHALLFNLTQIMNLPINFIVAGRIVSIFASLISSLILLLICSLTLGPEIGLISSFIFLFLPFNIFYSRAILPEPTGITFCLASIYFLLLWRKKGHRSAYLLISAVSAGLAILLKPYGVFLIAPACLAIITPSILKLGFKKFLFTCLIYGLLSLGPFLLWRKWMLQFPEGIPNNQWLFNAGNMRLRPAWWRWLFGERLGNLILAGWGLIPLGLGLISKQKNQSLFYFLLFGIFAYFVVFARGNIQHDYYQIIIIPIISIFVAKGIWFLLKPKTNNINRLFSICLAIFSTTAMMALSWYNIKGYYQINNWAIVKAGERANDLLPKDAKVIAPYGGDTAFLYQTNRSGWPAVTESIESLIKKGATHYVSVNFDDLTNDLLKKCLIIEKTDQWVIIDLTNCTNES